MKPTSEDYYDALYRIGFDESDDRIRQEILDRLAEWKITEIRPDSRPSLTKYGESCFTGLESGDWGTPEFNDELNRA